METKPTYARLSRGKNPRQRNAFMQPDYEFGEFYRIEDSRGETTIVSPNVAGVRGKIAFVGDFHNLVPSGRAVDIDLVKGWFARLNAPGYMDSTDWSGPFPSKAAARKHIEDTYDVDADSGEDLELVRQELEEFPMGDPYLEENPAPSNSATTEHQRALAARLANP